MKMTHNTIILVISALILGCESAPGNQSRQDTSHPVQTEPSQQNINNVVANCTSQMRKAIAVNFAQDKGVEKCSQVLEHMVDAAANMNGVKLSSANGAKLEELLSNYQKHYSNIYKNKNLFRQSHVIVQSMQIAKEAMIPHVEELSKHFLSDVGQGAKNAAYMTGRNELLLDRIMLNAELAINPGTENEKRVDQLDRMFRDTVLVGKITQGMLRGDKKLRIDKIKNKTARAHLNKAEKAYAPLKTNVDALLEIAPDVQKLRVEFDDLKDMAEQFRNL